MAGRLRNFLIFAYDNFAPLIVFFAAEHLVSLRAAILATVVFGLVDVGFRLSRRLTITRLYAFSLVVTLIFGSIDLFLTSPVLLKYESVVTNLLTAGFFGITLVRGTPLIQELAQKTLDSAEAQRLDIQQYLRFLTGVWTGYFILKAGVYAYISHTYSIDEAMAFRSVAGTASLLILLFGERLFRKPVFKGLQRLGWLAPTVAA